MAAAVCAPRLRVAVVGCGYWGSKHVRVLNCLPDVAEVVAVDIDQHARDNITAAFPGVRAFARLETAFRHVDAVIIATPPRTHVELAMSALRCGKHVLTEKPMGTSAAEACLLVEEARRSGLVLMVGHTFEFNPAVRELKRRVGLGELGQIYYIHSSRLNLGLYRSDVNVVWDLAAHDVSIMNYLLEAIPSSVTAWGSRNAWADVEDLAYIRLQYEELGVTGYVHVSWLDPNKVREVTVIGSKRMAVYNDLHEERLRIFDRGVEWDEQQVTPFERPLSYRYGDIISPHIRFEEPLSLEVRHFVDCIRDGAIPLTDGRNGLAVVAVLEAIDESLHTGSAVRVRMPAELNPTIQLKQVSSDGLEHSLP
ncbi:Gfo/Idh/MocA family oxidoreductase [Inquilinus limosus]|uniref:Gfo/Idh/MocA family protein n=1 Tax=Inquilinus limosus TaxID=171674 RepID=UPI003F159C69